MGRVDTAFSLLAGNQKLYGWLVGTPDLLQWAAWCTLHHNQATAFMSWALYILVKTVLQCLPWIKEGVDATVGLMIAGSSSRLHSLKVLSAKEEQKVSLRKSCLAAAESCKEGSIRKRLFSLQHILEPETKQLSATHLYSESSQKCHKTQILQRGRQEYFLKWRTSFKPGTNIFVAFDCS